jgi:hypothetical protein
MSILPDQKQLEDVPLAVVTIHDACPAFSSKIFKFTEEVDGLDIKFRKIKVPKVLNWDSTGIQKRIL